MCRQWLLDSGTTRALGGKARKLHRVSEKHNPKGKARFSSNRKLNCIIWLGSSSFLQRAAENAEPKMIVSSHGRWEMEASSVKILLKAEKLPETAKSRG